MRDDEMMDGVLRAAMSAPPPELARTFAENVLQRTEPRRLASGARVVVWCYALVSVAVCVWMVRDLPVAVTATATVAQAVVAVGLRAYAKSLTARPYPS